MAWPTGTVAALKRCAEIATVLFVCIVGLSLGLQPALASPNLLTNGGFEGGVVSGWTNRSQGAGVVEASNVPTNYGISGAQSGTWFCEIEGSSMSPTSLQDWIEQTPATTSGERYFMSIWTRTRQDANSGDKFILQANGTNLLSGTSTNAWVQRIANFNATGSTSVIRYISNGSTSGIAIQPGDGGGLMCDNAEVQELTFSPVSATTNEDTPVTITTFQIATNTGLATQTAQFTVTNGTLTLLSTTGLTFTTGSNGSASFTVSGSPANLNAAFAAGLRYTPNADFNGASTLTYTATATVSDTDTVPITVNPVADTVNDNVSTPANTAITFNVLTGTSGASADNFEATPSLTALGTPSMGTVSFSAAGSVTYTPNANAIGTDTFSYTVTSGGVTETGNITVTITGANLTLVKSVTNDNGGTQPATAWTLSATGPVTLTGATATASITNVPVPPGTYVLSEAGPPGYSAGPWACTAGTLAGTSLTLAVGQIATCTINNNDLAPLIVTKTSSVVSDPHNGTINPKAIPGATVRYCVLVSNPDAATATATAIVITDAIPAGVTYISGTIKSGTDCATAATVEDDNNTGADETDPIGASISGATLTANNTSLASGASFAIVFDAVAN